MTRNLKALGLALAAMIVIGAMGASAAQALPKFTSSEYTSYLTGSEVEGKHKITLEFGTLECETHLDGETSLMAPVETVKFQTTYYGCVAHTILGEKPATVTSAINECKFVFGPETGSKDTWEGYVELTCPTGKGIEIHIYNSAMKHTEDVSLCTYKVDPQKIKGIVTHNETPSWIKTTMSFKLSVTRITGTALTCGPLEQVAEYKGNYKFEFYNAGGKLINGHIG